MATYLLSAIQNGSTIDFDPAKDKIVIDLPDISAADLVMSSLNGGTNVLFQWPGSSFTLVGDGLSDLGSVDLKFADNSRFVTAHSANSWATSLSASGADDLLVGSRAGSFLVTASSSVDGAPSFSASKVASAISGDGRYVVFQSNAGGLLPGPAPTGGAYYFKDLATGELHFVGNAEISSSGVTSGAPALSAVGAKVAFTSLTVALTAADTNGVSDIYLRDMLTGAITLVSASATGVAGNGASNNVALSNDGRFAVFESTSDNLVAGDTGGAPIDVFRKDLLTGDITLVSKAGGTAGGAGGAGASISGNGDLVAFISSATTLVSNDTNATSDVFVKRSNSSFERVSVSSTEGQANGSSSDAAISANGRFVAFSSQASNLVDGDTNATSDVFLRSLDNGTTTLVSSSASGVAGNGASRSATVSGDGRYVAFTSQATNLVDDDTNGQSDVFVKDMLTGAIARVGFQFSDSSNAPMISADGSRISFDARVNGGFSGTSLQVMVVGNPLLSRTLTGGNGNDVYMIDNAADLVVEASGQGTDTVRSTVSLTLADNVEQLVLLGTSGLSGTGNALANVITGTVGSNRIDGGDGNDTVSYANAGDGVTIDLGVTVAQDTGAAGNDTLISIESATGSAFDDALFGTSGANVLNGGAGADLLIGGEGNDTLWADQAGDQLIEEADGGIDTVRSSVSWTLASHFENLRLLGSANINATGNSADNVLAGNRGANVLDGGDGTDTVSYSTAGKAVSVALDRLGFQNLGGSSGADQLLNIENLTGSDFNDTLHGNSGDNVFNGGSGNDTVSYLRANVAVTVSLAIDGPQDTGGGDIFEVTGTVSPDLDSSGGSEGFDTLISIENLVGGQGDDTLTGDEAANQIDGGLGNDILIGGAGNDTFFVDSSSDFVEELEGGGTNDSVTSSVSLSLDSHVEHLKLVEGFVIDGFGNALANRISGNSADNELDGRGGVDTLIGGSGNDSYYVDVSNDAIVEVSGGGVDEVEATASYTLNANIENLDLRNPGTTGVGNSLGNLITSENGSQTLKGLDGDDRLDGGSGADTLEGGNGNDTFVVDDAGDVVIEATGGGTLDTVESSISHTLAAEVERLVLTGSNAIDGTGNGLANTLTGNGAANVLDGGVGADTMAGGGGNDLYLVDGNDVVTESAGGGDDTQTGAVSFGLGENVEAGVLTGSANASITGNGQANTLTGNSGSNTLNAGGGIDTMTGGAGNDTYTVDDVADQVVEISGGGTDTVSSTVTVTLAAEVERLTLAGNGAINGTGNGLDNLIQGNAAANVLNGGNGIDTVSYAAVSSAVTANLTTGVASGGGGADSFVSIENLTGGSGNDSLTGSSGANVLDGGSGNDTMVGGGGNDIYVVGSAGDVVTEAANAGTDTINTSVSLTLVDGVERLTLTGSAALNGTGNGAGNTLTGNDAANLLDGAGGADFLVGGGGADTFRLASAGSADTLSDFVSGTDKILIGQSTLPLGDGDNVVDGAVATQGTGGFKPTSELVDVGTQVVGSLTTSSAAAAIGSATSAYAFGTSALFAVDNGSSTALFRFVAADTDAAVESFELTLLATLSTTGNVVLGDFVFGT